MILVFQITSTPDPCFGYFMSARALIMPMEQLAIIGFFTLKGFSSRMITAELESVDQTESLTLPRVKMWRNRFAEGRTSLCDERKY
jgi:hypothetical protein